MKHYTKIYKLEYEVRWGTDGDWAYELEFTDDFNEFIDMLKRTKDTNYGYEFKHIICSEADVSWKTKYQGE